MGPSSCKNLRKSIKEHIFDRIVALKLQNGSYENFNFKSYRDKLFSIAKNKKTDEISRKDLYELIALIDEKIDLQAEDERFCKYLQEKAEKKEQKNKEITSKGQPKRKNQDKEEENEVKKKKKLKLNEGEQVKQKIVLQSVSSEKGIKQKKEKIENEMKEIEMKIQNNQKQIDQLKQKIKDGEERKEKALKKKEQRFAYIKPIPEDDEDEENDEDWKEFDNNDDEEEDEEEENEIDREDKEQNEGEDEDEEVEEEVILELDQEELEMLLKTTCEDIEIDNIEEDFYYENDFEGYDIEEVTSNTERMKSLEQVYNNIQKHRYLTLPQRMKYLAFINSKFKNNLIKENISPCSHHKKVVFDVSNNKVKEFDLTEEVSILENRPTLVKKKTAKKNNS